MIEFFNSSVIRLPIFSFEYFQKTIESDSYINTILKNEKFMYALQVSSPQFYSEITSSSGEIESKIKSSILKYFSRASNRCTPFGTFSGNLVFSSLSEAEGDKLIVKNNYSEIIRFDSSLNYKIIESLNTSSGNIFRYFSNTTSYEIGKEIRYVEYNLNETGYREYNLTSIQSNTFLKKIILLGKNAKLISEYISLIKQMDDSFTNEELLDFIQELIDSKILISELDYRSMGDKTTEHEILNHSKKYNLKNEYDFIRAILKKLEKISDNHDFKNKNNDYRELITSLNKNFKSKNYFHHDIFFESEKQFSFTQKQRRLIKKSYEILQLLKSKDGIGQNRLNNFIQAFTERYENNPQPLTKVLDIESGIGYGSFLNNNTLGTNHLIKDLYINSNKEKHSEIKWSKRDIFLTNKIQNSNGEKVIILQDNDIEYFRNEEQNPIFNTPTAIIKCTLYKNDLQDVIHISSVNGSAANMLGRFTNNDNVKSLVDEITLYEKNFFKDSILAEVIHVPENRIGNIVQRNINRDYKIAYLSNPDSENNIFLDDLYIQYTNGELILFSKKENKKIIPFFSNAFNARYPSNLHVIEFLLDIQEQHSMKNNAYLNIEKYLQFYNHVPRIQYQDNIILSPEMWSLSQANFINFNGNILEFLISLKIPRYFYISEGDNNLLIDSENDVMLEILGSELLKKKKLRLIEFLENSFESNIENVEGNQFCNEILIPVKVNSTEYKSKKYLTLSNTKSNFFPNSEWIYYKIFIGQYFSNQLIIKLINVCKKLQSDDIISKFFYLKYYSPSYQIRLRINAMVDNHKIIYEKINEILKTFCNNDLISNIQIDTYKRELERYGYQKIHFFEDIFMSDSILSNEILKKITDNEDTLYNYTIATILEYCRILNIDEFELLNFSETMYGRLSKEFYQDSQTTKSYNLKYKKYEKDILDQLMNEDNYFNIFTRKKLKINDYPIEYLNKLPKEEKYYYLNSIMHMHIIRTVNSNNRFYEMIIYYFLKKSLKTYIIKERKTLY